MPIAYPKMKTGIVAVLDALGASSYNQGEIGRFMQSRQIVMELLKEKAEEAITLKKENLTTFTFNDTVIIALTSTDITPSAKEARSFLSIIRKFIVDSLQYSILFRGAFSLGRFHVDDTTNTIMGPAITDAAAWYDKSDWIGIMATPRASIWLQSMMEKSCSISWSHLIMDYPVPLKVGSPQTLKVVNWPKVFSVPSISPCNDDETPREKFHALLRIHTVPFGSEQKFFNSIAFFDKSQSLLPKQRLKLKKSK